MIDVHCWNVFGEFFERLFFFYETNENQWAGEIETSRSGASNFIACQSSKIELSIMKSF